VRTQLHRSLLLVALALIVLASVAPRPASAQTCARQIYARVVAIDQPFFWNRLGAAQPQGQIYALKHDVVSSSGGSTRPSAGDAMLRADKRPRPLVLRMNVGDCLNIELTNWLHPTSADVDGDGEDDQPVTRDASIHVTGMQLQSIAGDGSWVGQNASSLAAPNQTVILRSAPNGAVEAVWLQRSCQRVSCLRLGG